MIRFVVDSAADCRKEDGFYDHLVPMTVTIGGNDHQPGVDLDNGTFYELLAKSKEFPKTSQPSPQDFLAYFEQAKSAGDDVICFCISSALSGTYQSAVMAKELTEYEKIHVIDTIGATHMIGIMVEYAAKLRGQGSTALQIVDAVEQIKAKICVYAGLDTLEYLHKGGRLSGASAMVGGLAQIKPILAVAGTGTVEVQGKAIGKARAMQQITDLVQAADIDSRFPILSIYSVGEENCELLEKRLQDSGIQVAQRRRIGSTIGAHTGPGVYGVIFVTK